MARAVTPELLDQLDVLRAAATPGPWTVEVDVVTEIVGVGREGIRDRDGVLPADADLIVAAVNNLPELVAALRRVHALADEYEGPASYEHAAGHTACSDLINDLRAALAGQP